MKFISKNSNLNIILRPGQQAQPITGTPAVPALSVRFQDGMAEINDEALVEMMTRHPAFNQDFIAVEEHAADPYAHIRAESEPQHVTTEMQYGHPVARNVSPTMKPMSPEIKKLITEQATAIANQIVEQQRPAMMEEAVKAAMAILSQQSASAPTPDPATEEKGAKTTDKPKTAPKAK